MKTIDKPTKLLPDNLQTRFYFYMTFFEYDEIIELLKQFIIPSSLLNELVQEVINSPYNLTYQKWVFDALIFYQNLSEDFIEKYILTLEDNYLQVKYLILYQNISLDFINRNINYFINHFYYLIIVHKMPISLLRQNKKKIIPTFQKCKQNNYGGLLKQSNVFNSLLLYNIIKDK